MHLSWYDEIHHKIVVDISICDKSYVTILKWNKLFVYVVTWHVIVGVNMHISYHKLCHIVSRQVACLVVRLFPQAAGLQSLISPKYIYAVADDSLIYRIYLSSTLFMGKLVSTLCEIRSDTNTTEILPNVAV